MVYNAPMNEKNYKLPKLTKINILKIFDVAIDLKVDYEVHESSEIIIKATPNKIKFLELYPIHSPAQMREYKKSRKEGLEYLQKIGIVEKFSEIDDLMMGFDNEFNVSINPDAFLEFLEQNKDLYIRLTSDIEEQSYKVDSIEAILKLCDRFYIVGRQIRERYEERNTLEIEDEYDVQDLFHALLKVFFDDVRPEEWTPSYAGKSARMDFLIKGEGVVIEIKKTRKGLEEKEIGEQLTLDIAKYKKHPDCKCLICFVYDPEARIGNPRGLENDLSDSEEDLDVKVLIRPN